MVFSFNFSVTSTSTAVGLFDSNTVSGPGLSSGPSPSASGPQSGTAAQRARVFTISQADLDIGKFEIGFNGSVSAPDLTFNVYKWVTFGTNSFWSKLYDLPISIPRNGTKTIILDSLNLVEAPYYFFFETYSNINFPVGSYNFYARAVAPDTSGGGGGGGSVTATGQLTMAGSLSVVIASDQTPIPISGSFSLPSGSATDTLQSDGNTSLASIDGKLGSLGQKAMVASAPVVLASNQSAIPVTQSGTWNIGSITTLPAIPTGSNTIGAVTGPSAVALATSSAQTTAQTSLTSIDGKFGSLGQKAMVASAPVVLASDQAAIPVTQSGTWNIGSITTLPAIPTGSNTIGAVTGPSAVALATSSAQTTAQTSLTSIDGKFGSLGQKAMTGSAPVVLASDQTAIPVTQSGTWNIGSITTLPAIPTGSNTIGAVTGPAAVALATSSAQTTAQTSLTSIDSKLTTPSIRALTSADVVSVVQSTAAAAGAPWSVRLSDGSAFYDGAKTGQLPSALVSSRLDINVGAWLGSTAPTVGSKTSANSVPVVIASDQASFAVTTSTTKSATGTRTQVAASASSVTVLASNSNRLGATIVNDGTANLYICFGTTSTTSSYTVKMTSNAYYEVPFAYTGRIDGIWDSATGNAVVTEMT